MFSPILWRAFVVNGLSKKKKMQGSEGEVGGGLSLYDWKHFPNPKICNFTGRSSYDIFMKIKQNKI